MLSARYLPALSDCLTTPVFPGATLPIAADELDVAGQRGALVAPGVTRLDDLLRRCDRPRSRRAGARRPSCVLFLSWNSRTPARASLGPVTLVLLPDARDRRRSPCPTAGPPCPSCCCRRRQSSCPSVAARAATPRLEDVVRPGAAAWRARAHRGAVSHLRPVGVRRPYGLGGCRRVPAARAAASLAPNGRDARRASCAGRELSRPAPRRRSPRPPSGSCPRARPWPRAPRPSRPRCPSSRRRWRRRGPSSCRAAR